ncbi:DNA repair protein RadC [Muribaculaceae bacterium Isolate-104 (HZI)]|nr:DNA repair protein RadC [Muribaculaceae bacterium Isolate-104 (HZI)]
MTDNAMDNERPAEYTRRIADLSEDDRPREKAIRNDIRTLSNSELLAIILGGGMAGKSVMDLSREMLGKADNSLERLSRMPIAELCRSFKGVGPAKAVSLAAAFELGIRCRDEKTSQNDVVRSSTDAYSYMRRYLERLDREEFWIMTLSRSNRITDAVCISKGGTSATVVDIKLLMKTAVDKLASGIIAVHNHPSGNLRPSAEDDRLTDKIKEAAKLLDMRLLDHIIIAGDDYYSYTDNGRF